MWLYFWNRLYYFSSFHSFQKCPFNIWKTKRAGEFQEDELGSVAFWTETHVMNTGTFTILPLSRSLLILHRLETIHQSVVSVISPVRFQCSRGGGRRAERGGWWEEREQQPKYGKVNCKGDRLWMTGPEKRPMLLLEKSSVSRIITIHILLTLNLYPQPQTPHWIPLLNHLLLSS